MLKIGEFSRLAQVSVKTLRYYDELGLLRAAWVDRFTGYRYYTLDQLTRLNRVLALRELGFSLVQIAQLLREDLLPGELQRLMRLRQAELEHQVREEQARLARVAARLRQIEQEGKQPHYEVLVKRAPPRLVAGIRDTVADRADVAALFEELQSYLDRNRAAPGPASPRLALHYDAEFADAGADIEAAVPLARPLRGNARVMVHELPEVAAMASLVHPGGDADISEAYRALLTWTHANSYRIGGPNREVYLQGFTAGADPRSGVTEIQLPVEPIAAFVTREPKETQKMEPRIVVKPAFTVVGLPFTGHISHAPYEEGKSNNEIGELWDRFNARAGEVKHLTGPGIGLCFGMPNDTEPWYIAGMEVERAEEVPAGMMSMSVPAHKYAVFPCTLGALGATYRYITEDWQAQTGHEHADAPDFEYYDEAFDPEHPEEGRLSVYWPIR